MQAYDQPLDDDYMSSVFCTLEALDPLLNEIVTRCEEGQLQHFETTWVLQPVWCGKALGGISANAVLPAEGWCGKALGGSSANVVLPTENCGGEAPRGISANAVLPEGPDLEGGVISEAVATENRMNASEDEFGPTVRNTVSPSSPTTCRSMRRHSASGSGRSKQIVFLPLPNQYSLTHNQSYAAGMQSTLAYSSCSLVG